MVDTAEYWYKTTFQSVAGMTPFKAVYGREPPSFLRLVEKDSKIEEVNDMIVERNLILDQLKNNLSKAQSKMKKSANQCRRDVEYNVGDYVFLRL